MPTPEQVAARAKTYSLRGYLWGVGYCLRFARTCAGAPGGTHNAVTAWQNAKHRHASAAPPRGSFVFWSGGGRGHGHVAVSDGQGYCWSTDISRPGRVDRFPIAAIVVKWPNLKLLGWAEDINGVRVGPFPAPLAVIRLKPEEVQPGIRSNAVRALQATLRRQDPRLARLNPSGVTGYFGTETRAMVRAFQQSQGWTGADADGIPGPKTLRRLGLA